MQPMSLLPSLLRLCSTPQAASVLRAPFLSLTSFNPALSCPYQPVSQRRWYARRSSPVVAKARRNIFLDPKDIPSTSDTSLSVRHKGLLGLCCPLDRPVSRDSAGTRWTVH